MDLRPTRHSSKRFTVIADRQEFVAEISDLGADRPYGQLFGQVYDDACDTGFTMVSERTGQEAVFVLARTEHCGTEDHEVIAWHYIPTRDTTRRLPQLKGWKAVLLND